MDQHKSGENMIGYFELVCNLKKTLKSFRKTHMNNTYSMISETRTTRTTRTIYELRDNKVYYFGQETGLKNLK